MINPHRDTDSRHSGTHADGTVPMMVSAGTLIGLNVTAGNLKGAPGFHQYQWSDTVDTA